MAVSLLRRFLLPRCSFAGRIKGTFSPKENYRDTLRENPSIASKGFDLQGFGLPEGNKKASEEA